MTDLSKSHYTRSELENIMRMSAEGCSISSIADKYHRSEVAINVLLSKLRTKSYKAKYPIYDTDIYKRFSQTTIKFNDCLVIAAKEERLKSEAERRLDAYTGITGKSREELIEKAVLSYFPELPKEVADSLFRITNS
jgi:IS30 family transposase